jgi:hypothetical protein
MAMRLSLSESYNRPSIELVGQDLDDLTDLGRAIHNFVETGGAASVLARVAVMIR